MICYTHITFYINIVIRFLCWSLLAVHSRTSWSTFVLSVVLQNHPKIGIFQRLESHSSSSCDQAGGNVFPPLFSSLSVLGLSQMSDGRLPGHRLGEKFDQYSPCIGGTLQTVLYNAACTTHCWLYMWRPMLLAKFLLSQPMCGWTHC